MDNESFACVRVMINSMLVLALVAVVLHIVPLLRRSRGTT